jgi:hypothetical protein
MRTENFKLAAGTFADVSRHFSVFSFQFSIFNSLGVLIALALSHLHAASFTEAKIGIRIEEKALTLTASAAEVQAVAVYAKGSVEPLFGSFRSPVFVPATPFVRGQTYEVELTMARGSKSKVEVTFGKMPHVSPTARLSPATSLVPANTLKLYFDFSEPMEQGVFLKHLTLQRRNGEEVAGAFRETELWSPDGKRLTVMLHPGRQKAGVNLNVDEGPVLVAGERYQLVVSGQWRSTQGVSLGKEGVFVLEPIAADHEQPDPVRWQVHAPKAGTRDPLVVITDELFEPQIFLRALNVIETPGKAEAKVIDLKRIEWLFRPEKPWKPGEHEITIDPELEDMAGNTTQKPFEVDLTTRKPEPRAGKIRFDATRMTP